MRIVDEDSSTPIGSFYVDTGHSSPLTRLPPFQKADQGGSRLSVALK